MPNPMDRTRAEFVAGAVLALASMVVPMNWWLRSGLLVLMSGLAADLIWRSPLTVRLPQPARVIGATVFLATVAVISWRPVSEQYVGEGGLGAVTDFTVWFFPSEYFRLLLALLIGALIGNRYAPLTRPSFRRSRTVQWPNVKRWMTPLEAIEEFADKELRRQVADAERRHDEIFEQLKIATAKPLNGLLSEKMTALQMLRDGRPSDDDPKLRLTKEYNGSQVEFALARKSVIDHLIRQLAEGRLVAKGVLVDDKTHDDWTYVKSALWVSLTFDSSDPRMEKVSGGGYTYKGIRIGKQEQSPTRRRWY